MSKLSFIPYHVFCFTVLLSQPILNHIDATWPMDAENYILCLREKIKALKKDCCMWCDGVWFCDVQLSSGNKEGEGTLAILWPVLTTKSGWGKHPTHKDWLRLGVGGWRGWGLLDLMNTGEGHTFLITMSKLFNHVLRRFLFPDISYRRYRCSLSKSLKTTFYCFIMKGF